MKKVTEEKDIFDKIVDVGAIIGAIIFILSVIYAIIESNAEPEYDFSHLRRSSYGYGNSSSSYGSTYSNGNSGSQQTSSYYTPSKSYKSSKIQRVTLIMQRIIQTRKTFMTTIMMTFLIIMTQKTTITDINS